MSRTYDHGDDQRAQYSGNEIAAIVSYAHRQVQYLHSKLSRKGQGHLLPSWLEVENSALRLANASAMARYHAISGSILRGESFLVSTARVSIGLALGVPALYSENTAFTLGLYGIWVPVVEQHHWKVTGGFNFRALQFPSRSLFVSKSDPLSLAAWVQDHFAKEPLVSFSEQLAHEVTADRWAYEARQGDASAGKALLGAVQGPLDWFTTELSHEPLLPDARRDLVLTTFRYALATYTGATDFLEHLGYGLWQRTGSRLSDAEYCKLLRRFSSRVNAAIIWRADSGRLGTERL